MKNGNIDRSNPSHGLRGGIEWTQINCLTERKEIRLEKALAAIGQNSVAEDVEQRGLNIAPEIIRLHTNEHFDLQRHVLWRVDLQIVTCHAIRLNLTPELRFEFIR